MAGVITTEQVQHHRYVASRIYDSKNKWTENYTWFPTEQNKLYKRLDDVYVECRENYGDDRFMKYAQLNRLNKRFTTTKCQECLERRAQAQLSDREHYAPSKTTNGEYGRIPPSALYLC